MKKTPNIVKFPSGDPYDGNKTERQVNQITPGDLRVYHEKMREFADLGQLGDGVSIELIDNTIVFQKHLHGDYISYGSWPSKDKIPEIMRIHNIGASQHGDTRLASLNEDATEVVDTSCAGTDPEQTLATVLRYKNRGDNPPQATQT